MPDYGFGALAIGTGAQAGLQDLINRRLLEREMALREQSQAQEMDYRRSSRTSVLDSNLVPSVCRSRPRLPVCCHRRLDSPLCGG